MGQCPCPRCKIKKGAIRNLGTPADTTIRREEARIDNAELREKITNTRKLIYERGYVVNSDHVEDLLKPESLVSTIVRPCSFPDL